MPRLIDRAGPREDRFDTIAPGRPPAVGRGALVPLDDFLAARDRWRSFDGPLGVLLSPADDPLRLSAEIGRLSLIAVSFPSFTDGRGYSSARLVRERLGFAGELRAVGDVLRDQLFLMARCGFDSFALRDDQDVEACVAAFGDFSEVYQAAHDRGPLFVRRFPAATPVPGRAQGLSAPGAVSP